MSLFRELCGTRTSTNVSSNTGSDGNPTQTSTVDRQHAPLFSPSTATPTSGTRRRRDSDNYDYGFEEDLIVARPAGTVPITPGTAKRLKMSCKAIAHAYDIEAAPLESFVESPTLLYMMVDLKAHFLKIEKMLSKAQIEDIFESPEFKCGLHDRLLTALLSPAIPAYVTDVTVRMMSVIRLKSDIFKIPTTLFEDPRAYARLETMVSDTLTSVRSSIKQKIDASFRDDGNTLHIGLLAQKLLPRGAQPTMAHWVRYAFLRSAFRDFVKVAQLKKPAGALIPLRKRPDRTLNLVGLKSSELDRLSVREAIDDNNSGSEDENDHDDCTSITGKEYTPQQFWNYVDDYLEHVRTVPLVDVPDPTTREREITWFFHEALQVDIYNYRGGSNIPKSPSNCQPPLWQEAIQHTTLWN